MDGEGCCATDKITNLGRLGPGYFFMKYSEVFVELGNRRRKRKRSFERMFFGRMVQQERRTAVFTCPVCRSVLRGPVTLECGHTFCAECLESYGTGKCVVCGSEEDNYGCDDVTRRRSTNVLVQELVEKWKDRNKTSTSLTELTVPCAEDLLGVKPRYHLRSGYAGLRIDNDVEEKLKRYLNSTSDPRRRKRRQRRILRVRNSHNENRNNRVNERKEEQIQESLCNVFREVDDIKDSVLKSSWNCISISDLECVLCSRCLLDPVTTACGHTFCRGCLLRVLDHGLACPLCMSTLSIVDYSRGTTRVIEEAIQLLAPEELEMRISNNRKENLLLDKSLDIPVFVCTNAFPGVACPLNVYEPRYRLLARRCLQSSTKTFAMAGKEINDKKFVQYGTILEVRDAVNFEDGRFILTTVGIKRYKVLSKGEQDGYDTARVQYVKDVEVPSDELPDLIAFHDKVHAKASKWIRSLKPKVVAEVERLIGSMPNVEKNWHSLPDGPTWAWWLMPILPLSSQLQVGFLSTTSLEKRLRAIDKMLEHIKVKMKSVEKNAMASLATDEDSSESCGETQRSFEFPYRRH